MEQKKLKLLHKTHDKERLKKHISKSLLKPNMQIISTYIYSHTSAHTCTRTHTLHYICILKHFFLENEALLS